jgi:hypothetical protein
MAAMRDTLATAVRARNDSSPPRNAGFSSLTKNGRFPGNRIAALRHFQPLRFFNFGML